MVLFTTRIALVEIPTISPIMAAHIPVPSLPQAAAAFVLAAASATVVARRWSEPLAAGDVSGKAVWRRDTSRYCHESRLLVLALGVIALAECIDAGYTLWSQSGYLRSNRLEAVECLLSFPTISLSLALGLLAVQVVFLRRSKRSGAVAIEQPRLTPGIFLLVWLSFFLIIACAAPILGSWHFAAFLRSGYTPGPW